MKLKMTKAEFNTLYSILSLVCTTNRPTGIQAHVLHGTLCRLYKKFYRKAIEIKSKYSITADADEACAFYMFFSNFDLSGLDTFAQNLIHQTLNTVHQKYSA